MADPYSSLLASGTPAPVTPAPASTPQAAPASPSAEPAPVKPTPQSVFPLIPAGYNPKTTTPQELQAAMTPKTSLGSRLAAGATGAGNSILFGIPGAIANIISGKANTLQNAVAGNDPTGELGKTYNLGKVAGMGGNLAIGGVGSAVAKLAGAGSTAAKIGEAAATVTSPTTLLGKAFAAGGAKALGEGLQTLGTTGNAIGTGMKAALDSGTVQAINEVGQKDPEAAKNILLSSLTGFGVGAVSGGIGKALSNVSTEGMAQQAAEANKTYLSTAMDVKKTDLKFAMKNASQSEGSINDMINNAAQTAQKYSTQTKQDARTLLGNVSKTYQLANKAYDSAAIPSSQVIGSDVMADPVVQKFMSDHPNQGPEYIKNVLGELDKNTGDVSAQRDILNSEWLNGNKAFMGHRAPIGTNPADTIGFTQDTAPVATAIKGHLDDAVMDSAQQAGIDTKSQTGLALNEAKEIYGAFTPIRHSLARQALTVDPLIQGDSGTALSLLLSGAATGTGIGPVLAMGGSKIIQKVGRGVANQVAAETSPTMAKGFAAASKSKVPTAISEIGTGLNAASPAIGRFVGGQVAPTAGQEQPGQSSNQPMAETPGFPVDPKSPQFQAQLDQGIRQGWIQRGGNVNDPNFTSPQFQRFSNEIKRQISAAGPNAARVAAPVLFPTNPQNREAYLNFLGQNEDIAAKYPGAQFGNPVSTAIKGLPLVGNPAAMTARAQFQDAITKATGGAGAGKALMTQLDRANPKDRPAIIANALARNNPIAARLIQQLGGQQ